MNGPAAATCRHLTREVAQRLRRLDVLPQACSVPHAPELPAPRLWVCCECFAAGCSRLSQHQCMLKHALATRHNLCYSPADQMLWCYACDMELHENLILHEEAAGAPEHVLQQELLQQVDQHFRALRPAEPVPAEPVRPAQQDRVFGLANLGNTCFFNSVLQVLLATPELLGCLAAARAQLPADSLCAALLELAAEDGPDQRHPRAVFARLIRRNRMYGLFGQQDAHEALVTLLELVEEELAAQGDPLRLPFTSFLAYNAYCLRCRLSQWFVEENTGLMLEVRDTVEDPALRATLHETLREAAARQPLTPVALGEFGENRNIARSGLDLTRDRLSVSNTWEPREDTDLNVLLSQFFDFHTYSRAANNYRCERCLDASTHGYTRHFVLRPPPVFALCLKKFRRGAGSFEKSAQRLSFGEEVDFAPYALVRNRDAPESLRYALYAVVQHSGSLHGGHYVCYLRRPSGQWYYLSDAHVSPCTAADALAADAYLLFYRRVPD